MQRKFKYALFSTIGLLSLMLLPLSTRGDDIGHIAFSSDRGESHDIYIIDTNGQNLENLTNTPHIRDIYLINAMGGESRQLTRHPSGGEIQRGCRCRISLFRQVWSS